MAHHNIDLAVDNLLALLTSNEPTLSVEHRDVDGRETGSGLGSLFRPGPRMGSSHGHQHYA